MGQGDVGADSVSTFNFQGSQKLVPAIVVVFLAQQIRETSRIMQLLGFPGVVTSKISTNLDTSFLHTLLCTDFFFPPEVLLQLEEK